MAYFHHEPVFNTRTEDEERGWAVSPCGCPLLLDGLAGPSPKVPSLGSHTESPAMSQSLCWLFRMLLVLPSLQSHDFTSKPSIPDPPKVLWPLHPGCNYSTEFNR